MAWLRIDDGFTEHPKLLDLGDAKARWTWLEVLSWCARRGSSAGTTSGTSSGTRRGTIPRGIGDVIPRANAAFLARALKAGLLDETPDGTLVVHDWEEYNPRRDEDDAQAVEATIAAYPEASANDLARIIGGNRKRALEAIRRFRSGSEVVPPSGTGTGSGTGSRAGARARPVPSPTTEGEERPLGATPPLPQLDQPAESAERSPASRSGTGRKPRADEQITGDRPKKYKRQLAETWVRNVGWLDPHPRDAIHTEFPDIPNDELDQLAQLAANLADRDPDPEEIFR